LTRSTYDSARTEGRIGEDRCGSKALDEVDQDQAMANKTWFITGTSRGFGREWTKAARERGDRVAAAARDKSTLDDLGSEYGDALLALTLDVTDRDAAFGAVARAHEHFGGLDVVVKNAGYGHFGMVDEISEQEARAQIETNLFGALWVTQAALPLLAGGDQPGTGSRGQGVRDQRHARRAGGLLDRLERSVGQALQAESGL
jgi:NAD(P)-dependent dehydrogenase (short-subunit alcohol dehydrogenase family)